MQLDLLLCQSRPEFFLQSLFPDNTLCGSIGVDLSAVLHVDFLEKLDCESVCLALVCGALERERCGG